MILTRRSFLTGLLAAPIIIRTPGLLMPVRPLPALGPTEFRCDYGPEKWFIVYGLDRFGQPIQERIPLGGNGVHASTLKFRTITAIS